MANAPLMDFYKFHEIVRSELKRLGSDVTLTKEERKHANKCRRENVSAEGAVYHIHYVMRNNFYDY